jgi:hypothetical protein
MARAAQSVQIVRYRRGNQGANVLDLDNLWFHPANYRIGTWHYFLWV